jgi:hypothetical protein
MLFKRRTTNSDSLSLHSSGVEKQQIQNDKCEATFTTDLLYVVVERPADATDEEQYSLARSHCLQLMAESPPKTFECETSGEVFGPSTKVIVQETMLEKLPLLLDISTSTSSKEQAAAPLELPCSVWGFVSLLLLLEGSAKPSHWFRADCDASLPAQILVVCPHGCKSTASAHDI